MRAVGKRAGVEAEGPVVGPGGIGEAAAVDGDLHGADTHGVGSGAGNADGAGDGGATDGRSDGYRRRRSGDVDAEVSGSGLCRSVFHLHGEGEGSGYRGSTGNGAASIQGQAVRQCAAREAPGIRR